MFAYDYPLLGIFWSILIFALFVLLEVLLGGVGVRVGGDVQREVHFSGRGLLPSG